ncbi:MAG: tape measure protein [Clostridiales bacterium]|uniref:Tape measure protein n=1 Tax=Zhenhengia yiwuensis TaxID=2763666 RepID=A0A926EI93_9FIRM|nr:tape measure protein [Zhenhengia yiwuensis]MBC8581696.1 tape measure protein [Zhenhengia yiwuensis]MDU6360711.1 tape measure protein [Clostridiales bacterium]
MATIQQSMSLYDGVTGPLRQMQQAMALTLNTFESMQNSISENVAIDFGTQELEMARNAVNQLGAEMVRIQQEQEDMIRKQEEFTQSVRRSESRMNRLGSAAIAVNQGLELMQRIGNGINGFMKQADEAAMINSRIGMMNDGLMKHHELQKKILQMANDTRSGYAETVDLMSKLTMSGAFDSTAHVMDMTESINKAIRIGGGTDEMNKSAMLQLSQALGSGVLQGDELRSLSENAPYMMKVLADGLGVARGELKQMGADGELTTDVVIQAFENQRDVINSTFENIPRTWGDVTTKLGNSWTNFMQHLVREDGTGVLNPLINQFYAFAEWLDTTNGQAFLFGIASVIEWMSLLLQGLGSVVGWVANFFIDNWATIKGMLIGVGVILTSIFIPKLWAMIPPLLAMIPTLWSAVPPLIAQAGAWLAINWPILLIIGVIGLFMGLLYNLGITVDQVVGFITGLFFGFGAFVYNLFAELWNYITTWLEFFANVWVDPIGSVVRLFTNMADVVLGILETIANAMDALFNSNMADVVNGWRSNMQGWVDDTFGEQKVKLNRMEKIDVRDNFNKGYDFGVDLSNGATQIFEDLTTSMNSMGFEGGHIDSVGSIEDTVDVSNEDLEIMRELAEMESIQNFVTLTPKVNIKTGPVSKDVDIDEIVRRIEKSIEEEMEASTKEVYGLG